MKIVFIATRPYHPVVDGRSYTLNSYVKAMCQNNEVHYVCFSDEEKVDNVYGCKSVTILENSSTKEKLKNVLTKSVFGRKPLQWSSVYSKSNQKTINQIVLAVKPDIIIFDMIRMASYKKKLPKLDKIKYILDMDDILSNRYHKNSEESILGQFASKLPESINKIVKNKLVNRIVTSFERRTMRRAEKKAPKEFEEVILVSNKEVASLREKTKCNNISCWPVSVDVSDNSKVVTTYENKTLLFLGNLLIPQNLATFDYIVSNIMPHLDGFSLKVIGKTNEELKKKYAAKNIVYMDFVKELEKEAKSCLALVAPIQFGTGIKIKVVEMMGMGVPVITSSVGVDGLSISKDQGFMICNEPSEYISSIERLSKDEKFRKELIERQIAYIMSSHNFLLLANSINETFERVRQ